MLKWQLAQLMPNCYSYNLTQPLHHLIISTALQQLVKYNANASYPPVHHRISRLTVSTDQPMPPQGLTMVLLLYN